MSELASQQRRSRRFSFTSRRQPSTASEEVHPGPPVTTIGFPIELYPEQQPQEPVGPAWKRAFRRSQSVDRAGPSDCRASRRLVKKPPVSEFRRDASVSSEVPRKSMISSISTRVRSRRASLSNNAREEDVTDTGFQFSDQQGANNKSPNSSQPHRHDTTNSRDATQKSRNACQVPQQGQSELQLKNGHLASKQENAPTLRRVGSPFYHTASEKAAIARESPSTATATAYDAEWSRLDTRDGATNLDLWQDESMIPASLRIGRSKVAVDPTPKSPSKASLPLQESNASQHSLLPKYSPPADPSPMNREKINHSSERNLSLRPPPLCTEQLAPKHPSNPVDKTAEMGLDRMRSPRPGLQNHKSAMHEWSSMIPSEPPAIPANHVKTMPPRSKHAKTASSSSSSSAISSMSSSSTCGEPSTPISSNASTTHLEAATTNNNHSDHTSKKDYPRNTMSPKLDKYLAKIFVVCCHCNYWHDVPSGLYAKMIIPERLLFSGLPEPSETRSSKSSRSSSQARESTRGFSEHSKRSRRPSFVSQQSSGSSSYSISSFPSSSSTSSSPSPSSRLPLSSPTATVQCSWCSHEMAQSCCASWTTMVHLIERHH